jgi:(p)ppGpp synthase/HD superfamily hydrolase
MSLLELAISIAVEAHRGQTDKAGQPYILHPLRLMLSMKTEDERITAVLHDVIEDTNVTLANLREQGLSDEVLKAIELLTRLPQDTYEAFIERLSINPLSRRVKMADLADNMNISRLSEVTEKDLIRMQRYLAAWHKLAAIPGS